MKPTTKATIASTVVIAGLVTIAVISPRPDEPTPPPQMLTGTAHDPTIKVMWAFSTIRRHPMQDGSRSDVPFADAKAGDIAKFTMVCGSPERVCATGDVKLADGPLRDYRVVVIMNEVSLVYPIGAYMERSSWHRAGKIPDWEKRINSNSVALLGRAREQVGVRPWEERDAEIIQEDEAGKRRVVRP